MGSALVRDLAQVGLTQQPLRARLALPSRQLANEDS